MGDNRARPSAAGRHDVWLLVAAAVALACGQAARTDLGADYPTDAGPALAAIGHSDLGGFFAHQPAMGPLSLYVRAPFVALATALHEAPLGVYRWGCLPLMLAVATLAVWLARHAAAKGTGPLGQLGIVLVCLLNPLVADAAYWGHPEELLSASLAVGAVLAASERRTLLTGVLLGLAMAGKQWAVLFVAPALLVLGRDQLRALAVAGVTAALAWLPMAVNLGAAQRALHYVSHPQPVVTVFNWLYPFSPLRVATIANPFGDARTFQVHVPLAGEAALVRPAIIALGVLIPLLVWRMRARARPEALLLALALVCLLRCALDPGTMAYYHLPLLLVLVALDAERGRTLPVAGLAGAAAAFVVLDRFDAYLGLTLVNAAYIATTVLVGVVLLARLRTVMTSGEPDPAPARAPSGAAALAPAP